MKYEEVKRKIESEAEGSPSKRTQPVPCAYCVRGGNGDKSCSCGFTCKKYSKYNGCFAGELLPEDPNAR